MFMGFNIWELVLFVLAIVVVGVMIIPTKIRKPKPNEDRVRTIFGVCQSGTLQARNDQYITFVYRNPQIPRRDMRILDDFNIASIAQGNSLMVSVTEKGFEPC